MDALYVGSCSIFTSVSGECYLQTYNDRMRTARFKKYLQACPVLPIIVLVTVLALYSMLQQPLLSHTGNFHIVGKLPIVERRPQWQHKRTVRTMVADSTATESIVARLSDIAVGNASANQVCLNPPSPALFLAHTLVREFSSISHHTFKAIDTISDVRQVRVSSTILCYSLNRQGVGSEFPTIEDFIGNTPLVRLQRLPGKTSNVILAKLEGDNPAGSVKDRSAVSSSTTSTVNSPSALSSDSF